MFPDHDTRPLLQAGSTGALSDAAAYVRGRVCPDGAADGEDGDFDLPERQWSALLDWARAGDKILPLNFPGPEREGGREHDVTLDESTGRWIKYTKPASCGYTVSWDSAGTPYLRNALPLDYLQRLVWQNEILGDDVHLVGLRPAGSHQWSIVTTQPGLVGSRATLEELSAAFVAAGFTTAAVARARLRKLPLAPIRGLRPLGRPPRQRAPLARGPAASHRRAHHPLAVLITHLPFEPISARATRNRLSPESFHIPATPALPPAKLSPHARARNGDKTHSCAGR